MKKHKIKIPEGYQFDKEIDIDSINKNIPKANKVIGLVFKPIKKPIKKELPKTWEGLKNIDGYCITEMSDIKGFEGKSLPYNKNLWPTKELAEAALALSQLCQLRDHYNDGWVPNWADDHVKETVRLKDSRIIKSYGIKVASVLAFKNERLRDEFLSNFAELIETAKPLL